ncbi:replication factor C subunit 4 isoform X2 [Condylostylus longicornis]|uniref:replication factor C subunit 4 isoform X2 n=1 Tax=Condylostylus longicornis TaxID=2530218 RepID=UPI00244D9C78|nr:replication factor C subunit 4 isoform X2 [Condylostylus longicornis]
MQAFLKNVKSSEKITSTDGEGSINNTKRRTPWVEKYRPKKVEDVVEQAEIVAVLKQCLDGGDLPNMLLYGPPGTGKTSTILAAAHQLFGEIYKDRILELNASDERGINVVRTKIKNFAQLTANEADSMTHAAQAALRRTMEKESRSTRFCLICNYVTRIIDPITSRCTKFRFKSLGEEKVIERLKFICKEENVNIDENAYQIILKISEGDMRRAITLLQSCFRLKGTTSTITEQDLFEISGLVPENYMHDFFNVCKSGNYIKLEEFVNNIIFEAYSIGQMIDQFNEFVIRHKDLNNEEKCRICEKLGECAFRLSQGGSEYLQIMDLGCTVILALQKN